MPRTLLPRDLRREVAALLHQQCWCWGCDIRRPCGNLLVHYGATRVPPLDGRRGGSSAYHVALRDGTWLGLWGFGLAIVPGAGVPVLLGRYTPWPQVLSSGSLTRVWAPPDLPARTRTDDASAWWSVLRALRWIATYEAWVLAEAGAEWRDATTHEWEPAVVPGRGMAARWQQIVEQVEHRVLEAVIRTSARPLARPE
jgi:hypothetical protein